MSSWLRSFLLMAVISCLYCSWLCAEPPLLKSSDINKIMNQILEHHVEKKEITPKTDLKGYTLIPFFTAIVSRGEFLRQMRWAFIPAFWA